MSPRARPTELADSSCGSFASSETCECKSQCKLLLSRCGSTCHGLLAACAQAKCSCSAHTLTLQNLAYMVAKLPDGSVLFSCVAGIHAEISPDTAETNQASSLALVPSARVDMQANVGVPHCTSHMYDICVECAHP